MKAYIHARLSPDDRRVLDELKRLTGQSESDLVRQGLRMARASLGRPHSALDLAGRSVGRFPGGPKDLSTHPRHFDGFGR
jgi:hypothetical protein